MTKAEKVFEKYATMYEMEKEAAIGEAFKSIGPKIKGVYDKGFENLSEFMSKILASISEQSGKVTKSVKKAPKAAKNAPKAAKSVGSKATKAFNSFTGGIKRFPKSVKGGKGITNAEKLYARILAGLGVSSAGYGTYKAID